MSLRKGVLLRSHRKSISELDLKQSKKDTNNASLNGTFTKEKRGINIFIITFYD